MIDRVVVELGIHYVKMMIRRSVDMRSMRRVDRLAVAADKAIRQARMDGKWLKRAVLLVYRRAVQEERTLLREARHLESYAEELERILERNRKRLEKRPDIVERTRAIIRKERIRALELQQDAEEIREAMQKAVQYQ